MKKTWYKEGIVYQIYPRSFKDSNNDGVGDLRGIIEKLDYLKDLGVSIIWLSPIYDSPLDDNGYDISNYYQILPEYGTMDDFKELINGLHERGIALIMDLVVNHTSDEHPWFIESRKSVDNPYRDYYIWKEGIEGKTPGKLKAPNKWGSFFGGSAWEYDEVTNQYYLHLFSKKQPDLNWDNPKVREEVKKILTFWLDLGVDGFRCDVINIISKREGLPEGKWKPVLRGSEHYINGPKVHEYLHELYEDVLSKYQCFTVGESVFITPETALDYIADWRGELNMLFQFDHMNADCFFVKWFGRKFKPVRLKKAMTKWQYGINGKGWNTLYLENHDQPRSVSRFGSLKYREESAKMLATYFLFQQGTPFIYQGQEIGMTNAHFTKLSQYRDVESMNIYRIGTKKLLWSKRRMLKKLARSSRDNARTPMQWSNEINGGFSEATPWIEVNTNYETINVKNDLKNKNSILKYYQKIIALRKKHEIIVYGDYLEHYPNDNKIVCYERNYEDEKLVVVANFTGKEAFQKAPYDLPKAKLLLNNYDDDDLVLKPYQAKVYLFKK
ncbi:MAG TPA: alpha-glucosidase [Bacilli bacterium]|jgi:oligo-1,6-glucosidase|nr:alpha-glucosidase [Acholeplasmataceae bacterium]HNZ77382.1 alpha-glucosidase [Bacilli bacterium]HOD61134.1 alpha-glucosidase [Bacilli bacterium]HOH61587.1 alpha-glucosidase [Bacilli bacterium]HPM14742.1 alpha-glucosidase [Bacilli bacterium]